MLKVMSKDTYLYIKKNWCKRCDICIEFCPKNVYKKGEDGYPKIGDIKKCTQCRICVAICPEFAIITDPKVRKNLEGR